MAEKILNTRIGLKYDLLSNWTAEENQFVLKKGEVAFATVAATAGSGLTEPVIMAKIGDGSKTFNGLTWDFYAKASDVHTWAKKNETEFTAWVKGLIDIGDIDLSDYYTKEEIDALLKTITDAAAALAERVTALEGLYDKEERLSEIIAELNEAISLKADKTYVDEELGKKVSLVDFENYKTTTIAPIATDVATIKEDYLKATDLSDYAKTADVVTNEEFVAFETTNNAAIAEAKKAGTDAAGALEQYKTTNDARIETILNGTDAEKVDSLNELINWVDEHGGEVEEIKKDIEARVTTETYEAHLTTQDARDDGQDAEIQALKAKEGLDKVGTVTSITAGEGLDGGTITESGTIGLNAATKASLGKADTAVQPGDLGTMAKETVTDYVKKTEAIGYGDILTKTEAATTYQPKGEYATAEQGGKADTAVQPENLADIATSGNVNDLVQTTGDILIFDCGSATKNI